jgi:hypothetical protein
MSITAAARKVKMSVVSAFNYYNVYKNDPEKKNPLPRNRHMHPKKHYTLEQIGNLFQYINSDKMTVKDASAKANIPYYSCKYYYNKYLEDPNHNIPIPRLYRHYTKDQKNEFIGYIINDKMTIRAASRKARMNKATGYAYYHKYFEEQNPDIATPNHIATPKCYTQEQIKQVISFIIDDDMTISAASRKANLSKNSAGKYYRQYLKSQKKVMRLFLPMDSSCN